MSGKDGTTYSATAYSTKTPTRFTGYNYPPTSTPTPSPTPTVTPIPTSTAIARNTPTAIPSLPLSATISVNNFSFSPSATLISTGVTITWQFQGGTHTVSGSGFDSGTKISGQTFSHTFNQSGNYNYVCSFHSSMTGTVKVE